VIVLLLLLVVLGAGLWTVEQSIQMSPAFRNLIRLVVIVIVIWYALGLLGLTPIPRP
jgi:hypothetical protein